MLSPLAVIIPCLNEAENLRELLPQLCSRTELEIIVVDGGSMDESRSIANQFRCKVLESPRGRGRQLNTGARATRCRKLLFLHADTRLADSFPAVVAAILQQDGVAGGAFSLTTDSKSPGLRLVCAGANIRSRLFHLPYGDQAIFTTSAYFNAVGGYPEVEIMEDYIFVRRLAKLGRIVIAEQEAVTSARRWEHLGIFRTTLINQLMVLGYRIGIAPHKLARLYQRAKGIGEK